MFYLNWYHAHTDNIFLDGCWCTCSFSSTLSWFFFTALTGFCNWFLALWVVSIQSCWIIFLTQTENSSPQAVSSIMVLANWFIATKTKFLLHQKLPSVSIFHLLIAVASIKFMDLLAQGILTALASGRPLLELTSQSTLYCPSLNVYQSDPNTAQLHY